MRGAFSGPSSKFWKNIWRGQTVVLAAKRAMKLCCASSEVCFRHHGLLHQPVGPTLAKPKGTVTISWPALDALRLSLRFVQLTGRPPIEEGLFG